MKSSNTDKHLNVRPGMNWSQEKFRDIRAKATDEYNGRKLSKKKKKSFKVPCYEVGDRIVLAIDSPGKRDYTFVEVLDFRQQYNDFKYYAVILRVTGKKRSDRVGRLCTFNEKEWGWTDDGKPANVTEDGITWLEE